jgi:6-phosphogluconolactonase
VRFFVGAYSGASGEAEGIGVLEAGDAGDESASGELGMLPPAVRATGSPSWIAAHPTLDTFYAALEDDGAVQAYRRTGETTLTRLGDPVEAGDGVCHVAVAPDGGSLLAACRGDGRVVRVVLDAAGRPASRTVAPAPADPYGAGSGTAAPSAPRDLAAAARALRAAAGEYAELVPDYDQEPAAADEDAPPADRASRAHASIFLAGGWVATTDLGLDLVRLWRPAGAGLRLAQEVALPRGSGPRHGLWHPSGHLYVLTEHSCEVFVLAPDREGRWSVRSGEAILGALPGDAGAELAVGRDGETLYAGVRGSDGIAVLRVRGAGESLTMSALVEAGTAWPRHHVVVGDRLLVAGQRGDEVVSRPLDARTGLPGSIRRRAPSPSPSCLLPLR